ncbi:hypothetical protein AMK23_35125 [Streptomyces sp. CB02130]|nr:hypothetical protein AMK23_35125 [Streptomyces sp. CB02130]
MPGANGITARDETRYLYDYAVARLGTRWRRDDPLFDIGWPGTETIQGATCNIVGYSGDKDRSGWTQYLRTGHVAVDEGEQFVSYQMSSFPGDSGAAVYYKPTGRGFFRVIALHVSGVSGNFNFGTALTDEVVQHIQEMRDSLE